MIKSHPHECYIRYLTFGPLLSWWTLGPNVHIHVSLLARHPPQVARSWRDWNPPTLKAPSARSSNYSREERLFCVSAPSFLLGQLYLWVHRLSSSGPPQTALLKEALSPTRQALGPTPATLLHVLSFNADFQRESLLFCASQIVVVIFLSFSASKMHNNTLILIEQQHSRSAWDIVSTVLIFT